MRSLSERNELRRSWMGGAAAQFFGIELRVGSVPFSLVYDRAAAPPIPTFPHKGGRGPSSSRSGCCRRNFMVLTEEQQAIVDMARAFAEGELKPHATEWEAAG